MDSGAIMVGAVGYPVLGFHVSIDPVTGVGRFDMEPILISYDDMLHVMVADMLQGFTVVREDTPAEQAEAMGGVHADSFIVTSFPADWPREQIVQYFDACCADELKRGGYDVE